MNNLVFQPVSRTTQHKPSKANSTCVLTASVWWKTGFWGRIISQKRRTYVVWPRVGCPFQKWVGSSQLQRTHRVSFLCKNPMDIKKVKSLRAQKQLCWESSDCSNKQTAGRSAGHCRAGHGLYHPLQTCWDLAGPREGIQFCLLPVQFWRALLCTQHLPHFALEACRLEAKRCISEASFLEHVNTSTEKFHHKPTNNA